MNNRVKGMTADGDCRQEKLCTGKHQKSKQILVTENAMYVLVHHIIMTNDNERFQLLLTWCYS